MSRKVFFLADWVVCCIMALLAWHFQILYKWSWIAQVILVYLLLLRLNLCALLYEKEKRASWSLLLFLAIIIFMPDVSFYFPAWHYVAYGWFICVPIVMWLMNMLKGKSSERQDASVLELLGMYMFERTWSRKCLGFFALFAAAFLLGEQMEYGPSMFGIYTIPIVAYFLLNKEADGKPTQWEYAVLAGAMVLFVYSQHPPVFIKQDILWVMSGAMVLVVCAHMYQRTRKVLLSIVSFFLTAFILPVMILGYNIYAVRDAWIVRKYTDNYIRTGVLFIGGKDGYGIRDRYGIVVPTKYKEIVQTDWERHYVKVTDWNGNSEIIDITKTDNQ